MVSILCAPNVVLLRVCAFAASKRWTFFFVFGKKEFFILLQLPSYSVFALFILHFAVHPLGVKIISISGYWFCLHFEFRSKQKVEVTWSQDTCGYRLCWNFFSRGQCVFASVELCICKIRLFGFWWFCIRIFCIENEWWEMKTSVEWISEVS